jgi:tetratricopeptide (TPR) repeat protein
MTTDSELALQFYEAGQMAFDLLKTELAKSSFNQALKEDPDFFMAQFWLYFTSGKSRKKVADGALKAEGNLNEGEKQIQLAFKYLISGDETKVVEHLKKATELYPEDPHVHKILYILQFHYLKDVEGALESIANALEAVPDYPMAYNQMGYAFMDLEEYDKAEEALDTYIRLAPDIANPYDSKGDYYMSIGKYQEAYDSYMRAYNIDADFMISKKKAAKAKQLMKDS